MSSVPCICVVKAAKRGDLNKVWEAMGRGTNTFIKKACHIDTVADENTPATHYVMQDMSATLANEIEWKAMASSGDLPAISGVWGEDGVISAADAQAAISNGNLVVVGVAGIDPNDPDAVAEWSAGTISGQTLQLVPEGEF